MLGMLDNLCGCFSPQIKKNIIQYLSSQKLNRQVIEQQKCSQQNSTPSESIYAQAKMKSYYFMKVQQEEVHQKQQQNQEESNSVYDNTVQPNYYPHQAIQNYELYDEIYSKKLVALKKILKQEIGPQYSKIYDSQDELSLRIYCKQEIYASKRYNSYRFCFSIHNQSIVPQDFLKIDNEKASLHEPLLNNKQFIATTQNQLEIHHRCYKKILVINQHDFYTAQKGEMIDKEVYNTCFSVKGQWQKMADHNRGWINLSGLKISMQEQKVEEQVSTSLREEEGYLRIEGYLNIELQISVNANMLKQPIAKQIRTYVQKLVCSLTKSDAI